MSKTIPEKCPLCKGSGERTVITEYRGTKHKKVTTEFCVCKKSSIISQQYKLLSSFEDEYLFYNEIDNRFEFYNKLSKSPNFIIKGNEKKFLLNIKSILMKLRFNDPAPSIYFCRSIDILQRFYVPQSDGETLNLSFLDNYDLLIFTLDNREKNDQLKNCILQVVYSRFNRKPTWIYLPRKLKECNYEYTPELEQYLNQYIEIDLKGEDESTGPSKSQYDAANFS